MKKHLSLFLFLLTGAGLCGQVTIEREVIGSLGHYFANAETQVSATAGEAAVQTRTATRLFLAAGFQRAEPEDLTSVRLVPELLSDLSVYPNPTAGQFWIRAAASAAKLLHFEVLDAHGRLLFQTHRRLAPNSSITVAIDSTPWPAGLYLVRVQTDQGTLAGSARLVIGSQ